MVDKSKLTKDVEEQIQSLASDVYIQVEDKLTSLIASAVQAQMSQATAQQNKNASEKDQVLTNEISQLKQAIAEHKTDQDINKQNFQVELTQNSINYTETIERLEKQVTALKQQKAPQQDNKKSNNKLDEKLLETEQKLNDKNHEVDGLNGRIMVLTEQELSLTKQLTVAEENKQLSEKQQKEALAEVKSQVEAATKQEIAALTEKLKLSDKQQTDAVLASKKEAETAAKKQTDALTEKLTQLEKDSVRIKGEVQKDSESKTKELEQQITQLTEQVKQEQNGKTELQQQLSVLQKSIDTEQDKNKQSEQKSQDYQATIIKITEASATDRQLQVDEIKAINVSAEQLKQQHLEEVKLINEAGEEAKHLQKSAQQKIIELEKTNESLSKQIDTEQNDIKLYQQEVGVLNEQVKVAQEGQENILLRFNSNRDKQEIENNKIRETIKFLRDENHQLLSDNEEQKTQFTDQINELDHKLTEYRLKFEYAQKQLAN